jgi:arylsulfatase A-like enzyme
MFVRWPGQVKPLRDDNTLASIIDIAPTVLRLAGAKMPSDLRGLDLTDRKAMTNRKSVFGEAYTHDIANLKDPQRSLTARVVIDENYKLIIPGPARPDRSFATTPEKIELYDLKSDPLETNDLAAKLPEVVSRLEAIQNAEWDLK